MIPADFIVFEKRDAGGSAYGSHVVHGQQILAVLVSPRLYHL